MNGTQKILIFSGIALFFLWPKKTRGSASSGALASGMLGKYFSLQELTSSGTAEKYGIEAQYSPPESVYINALSLTYYLLDPVRKWLGGPITVSSWYRSPELTAKLLELGEDTVKNTTHVIGGTADLLYFQNGENKSGLIVRAILAQRLPFDRILIEYGSLDAPNHIHLEYDGSKDPDSQRGLILRLDSSGVEQKTRAWAEDFYL